MNFKALAFWRRDKGGDYSPPGDRYETNNVYPLNKPETPFKAFTPHSGGVAPEEQENVSAADSEPSGGILAGPTADEVDEAYRENWWRDHADRAHAAGLPTTLYAAVVAGEKPRIYLNDRAMKAGDGQLRRLGRQFRLFYAYPQYVEITDEHATT